MPSEEKIDLNLKPGMFDKMMSKLILIKTFGCGVHVNKFKIISHNLYRTIVLCHTHSVIYKTTKSRYA